MHFLFAFSIHHFISSVGADAGFAAIIGLAILVLLYFAQARETTTLRDEAISASQRVEQLERRVAALGSPAVTPPPEGVAGQATASAQTAGTPAGGAAQSAGGAAAPAGPPVTGVAPSSRPANPRPLASPAASAAASQAPGRVADAEARPPIPAAPAGVGAPALIDATRLIPVSADAGGAPQAGAQAPPGVEPAEADEPDGPQRADQQAKPTAATALATPPPATAAAGAAGPPPIAPAGQTGSSPIAASGPPTPVGANGASEPERATAGAGNRLPPRLALRPDAPGLSASLSPGRRSARTRWLPALVALLLAAAVAVVLLVVTSNGSSARHTAGTRSTNAPVPATGSRAGFKASSVTVAVLNGTDVSQLAHRVAQKLAHSGYRGGAVATAADQTHTTTIVAFLPGFRTDASHVAGTLTLPATAVQAADQSARAIACPPPGACSANVIVTVGSDLTNSH